MPQLRTIKVFLASPSDLTPERKVFREKLDELNGGYGDGAKVRFDPRTWEDVPATTGRRVQDVINPFVDESDFFILALNRRWGQSAPDSPYSSYTEEEFRLAMARWTKRGSPEVIVLFKHVDEASLADPGPQLQRVLEFRKELEAGRKTLARSFASEDEFGKEVDLHLRQFAEGRWESIDMRTPAVELSEDVVAALDRPRGRRTARIRRSAPKERSSRTGKDAKEPRRVVVEVNRELFQDEQSALALARAAVKATAEGQVQDATILFAKASEGTTNPSVLKLAADFYKKTGDLENHSRLVRRLAASTKDRMEAARHYLELLPKDWNAGLMDQLMNQILAQFPAEIATEIRSITEEVYGNGKFEAFMLENMVKHYSTRELEAFCRFAATPEAKSILQKQPLLLQALMQHGQRQFQLAFLRRYPEAADEFPELAAAQAASADGLPDPLQLPASAPSADEGQAAPKRRTSRGAGGKGRAD